MLKRSATIGAIAATLALTATTANAATLTTSGTGFKLLTSKNITSIKPSQQFTVTFESATTKTKTSKYLARALPQINAAGVKLAIGGVEAVAAGKCPPRGHIYIKRVKSPLGTAGKSRALPCHDTTNNTAWGGIVEMESRYYDGTYTLPAWRMWNVHVHEVLHNLGLDHPNYDRNKNGTVEDYECVATSYGNRPIMCTPNGGYSTSTNQGKLVGYDINGLQALIANAKAQGLK